MSVTISGAMQNAMCNALVDGIDAGSGPGYIQFRTGEPPATPQDANSGTLLVTKTFADPAFSAAGSAGFQPTGQAAMLSPGTPVTITGAGQVGHFRIFDSNNSCVMQGLAGPDTGEPGVVVAPDIEVGVTDFEVGGTITIQSLFVFVPPT